MKDSLAEGTHRMGTKVQLHTQSVALRPTVNPTPGCPTTTCLFLLIEFPYVLPCIGPTLISPPPYLFKEDGKHGFADPTL